MTDEELVKQGRAVERDLNNGFPMTCEKGRVIQEMASRIEALTAKLDGLQDRLNAANKARAYVMGMALKKQGKIDALEAKLAICEKYRDAYAECDRIGTQAVRDMEVKLAKAHEKEIAVWSENYAAMERKLYAARAGTKKAEAYAEELEKERDRWREIANNEAVEGEANRNAGLALEAKLAEAVEALRDLTDAFAKKVDVDQTRWKTPYEHPLSAYDRAVAFLKGENP
jgi:chromosome segregation ATPase